MWLRSKYESIINKTKDHPTSHQVTLSSNASMNALRRVSYVFLCIVPFLSFVVVGVRAFRVPGVY
jgi:hypothetical protein